MAVGDYINYANYKAMDGSSWRNTVSLGTTGSIAYYISAPAFRVYFTIRGSGLWGYQEGSVFAYPYDKSTGKFSSSAAWGFSSDVRGSSSSAAWNHGHNYSSDNASVEGDISDVHLWKVVVYKGDNDGSASGTIYAGGMGLISESTYNNYFKNRKIYCSEGNIWTGYSDEGFLSAKGYSCMKGTPISISTGTYKYVCANHEIP